MGTSIGASTDATGHYAIYNVTPGEYTVEASCMGYRTEKRRVHLKPNETTELKFEVVPDAMLLDQVVATGNKSEVHRRNSSSLINVVGKNTFDLVSAASLADGLNFQPGVRVENDCQNCGFTQVRINGLDGHYSQILMNSRPMFSALAGVYGLEQIPANMIDRVEMMRGGGSALFGSSAIGGTINIITKDPVNNSAEASHTLTSIGISGALENNTTANASVVSNNGDIGLFVFGQNRTRDGYDHNGDGFTEIPELKSQTLGLRAFMRPTSQSKLSVEYHGTHEYRRGGDSLDLQPHQAYIAEQVEHNIHALDVSSEWWTTGYKNRYSVYASMQDIRRKSYYGADMDLNAYGKTHDLVALGGGQYIHSFDKLLFMPAEFTAGIEYNYNHLNDITIGYNRKMDQNVNIYSAFLQNEWRTDRWGILIGGRLDKHSMVHNVIFSPRANLRFNPSEHINLRLTYSSGFRAPQAYDEDMHIAIVGGERVVTVLAPNLKQESSNSVSASVDLYYTFGSVQTNFLVEAFYTGLRDVFVLRQLDQPDSEGNAVLERCNGSGAKVMGINVEGKAGFSSKIQAQAGITLQRSRYDKLTLWSASRFRLHTSTGLLTRAACLPD